MKASVVKNIVDNDLNKVDCFILTSTANHYTSRMSDVSVDVANEILKYTDITDCKYIVDCNDINMVLYKKGEISSI